MSDPTLPPPVQIPAVFKMVFFTVLALTVVSLGIVIWIAAATSEIKDEKDLPYLMKSLSDICRVAFQMGFGAIIGLIGGKATEFVK